MKISMLFLKTLVIFFFAFATSQAFAQNVANRIVLPGSNPQGAGGINLPKINPHRRVRCEQCSFLTRLYNDAREDILDQEEHLDDIDHAKRRTEQQLNQIEAEIANLKAQFIRRPSASLGKQIEAAERQQQSLSRQYGRQESEYSNAERHRNNLLQKFQMIETRLNDCEARYCRLAAISPATRALYAAYVANIQLGLLMGNLSNSLTGYINTPTERFSGSHSQNNFMFGPQARFMFGSPEYMHAFLLLNAVTLFNATNNLLGLRTDRFSNYQSTLRLRTLWIAHMLIGLQSALFYNNFSVSGGVGGAVINQELNTSIAENVITNDNKSQTSLTPSWMLSLDYKICKSCVAGHDLSLSGQLTADKYPGISSTVVTPLGNSNRGKVGDTWQYSEALVLSMQF